MKHEIIELHDVQIIGMAQLLLRPSTRVLVVATAT